VSHVVPVDQAVTDLLALLGAYVQPAGAHLPPGSVVLLAVTTRSVGIGGRRGTRMTGTLGMAELRGIQVQATARYQLWSADQAGLDRALTHLTTSLFKDLDTLRGQGLLQIGLAAASAAEPAAGVAGALGRRADYALLYEYRYEDSDDAIGLISQIPVAVDREVLAGPDRETSLVTDQMTRWDASHAPALVIRGPLTLTGLSALVFAGGGVPRGQVRLVRTFDGAPAPVAMGSLAAFLAAVGGHGALRRNASWAFADFAHFQDALAASGEPIGLGEPPDSYRPLILALYPPLSLATARDRFEVAYADPALDAAAVCYLRAG
jgi:hypothetical protein